MKRSVVLLALVPLLLGGQQETLRVGIIDFFGASGLKVAAIRAALPVHPGDTIREADFQRLKQQVDSVVRRQAGAPLTDFSVTCCNKDGGLMIYIGLPGKNSRAIPHLPAPHGSACVPAAAAGLYDAAMNAMQKAVRAGDSAEDHSQGYALSHNPEYRARQLSMREYAVGHGAELIAALAGCREAANREAAAQLLGYATRSPAQIAALVRAGRDPDAIVRNNATRALWVIAQSGLQAAAMIPASPFVAMLNSGTWEDRNKAGLLLSALAEHGDRKVLAQLRSAAFDSLAEMARWQEPGHAAACRQLLGKIAGLDDATIQKWIEAGKVEELISAARQREGASR